MTARDIMTTGDYMTISYSIDNIPDENEPKSKMPRVTIFARKNYSHADQLLSRQQLELNQWNMVSTSVLCYRLFCKQ
jgi:uncharacterized membrane-anchored protein